MATPNYEVNYDDARFAEVQADKQAALGEIDQTYGGMVSQSDQYYNAQIEAAQNWADQEKQIQQQQTDFAIEKINQEKEQAKKDYTKEQSGAYVDWQRQSNQYGANAEQMAAQGMSNTGYSESSQVGMYNTYQNRVATARESYQRAVLNYDNAIKDAQLQNNAALAEIAYNALQTQLELSLQGFQYKNSLLMEQAATKREVENNYYNRYQDVLNQINTENALAEQIRQYNEKMAFESEQARLDREHGSSEAQKDRDYKQTMADNELRFKEEQAKLDREHDLAMQNAKTEDEKELLQKKYEIDKALLELELEAAQEKLAILPGGNNAGVVSGDIAPYTPSAEISKSPKEPVEQTKDRYSVVDKGIENIANTIKNGRVTIPGHGDYTWTELYALEKAGQVKEEKQASGKIKYVWVGDAKADSKTAAPVNEEDGGSGSSKDGGDAYSAITNASAAGVKINGHTYSWDSANTMLQKGVLKLKKRSNGKYEYVIEK